MEKIRSLLCLFLTAVVLLSACQKDDSSPQVETSSQKEEEQQKEEITLEPVEAFDSNSYTNAMMLEDYDFFWTTLEENCAALGALQEVAGVDLEQIKTEGREQVTALADGDATGFSSVISTIAQKMGGFAHIRPMKPDAYYRLMDGNMWESDTQQVIFSEDKVRAFYQWQSSLSPYKETLEETIANNESQIRSSVTSNYQALIQARSDYEQAQAELELQQKKTDTAALELSIGQLSQLEYKAEEYALENCRTAVQLKEMALLQSLETYKDSVNGLAAAS